MGWGGVGVGWVRNCDALDADEQEVGAVLATAVRWGLCERGPLCARPHAPDGLDLVAQVQERRAVEEHLRRVHAGTRGYTRVHTGAHGWRWEVSSRACVIRARERSGARRCGCRRKGKSSAAPQRRRRRTTQKLVSKHPAVKMFHTRGMVLLVFTAVEHGRRGGSEECGRAIR